MKEAWIHLHFPYMSPFLKMSHKLMKALLGHIIRRQFAIALGTLYCILTSSNIKTKGWFGSFFHHTMCLFYEAYLWQCGTLLASMGVFLL